MVKPATRQAHESWARRDEISCALGDMGCSQTRRSAHQACFPISLLCCIKAASESLLVGLDTGRAHEFAGGLGFNADEIVKSRRRHGHGRGADYIEPVFELFVVKDFDHLGMQVVDDGFRRCRRRHHADPEGVLRAGETRLCGGRHIGQVVRAGG